MAHYHISYTNPQTQFILVRADFEVDKNKNTKISLSRWRPGRYEIQNFAKRIRGLRVTDASGNPLKFQKSDLSEWEIEHNGDSSISVHYEYYAALMDAGNTWLDSNQLYVNPINCLVYIEEQRAKPCSVQLDIPDDYEIATGLETKEHLCTAPSYNILVDSPIFASNTLRRVKYRSDSKDYNIWFQGHMPRKDEELQKDFTGFTDKTLEIMGALPCEEYHFLNQILPYRHYHGVEHWNSTVITIGPSEALAERERYVDFLGVSCHELFHTWNVIRLRPEEMIPYQFQQPNLHTTGFITEGITTYYGDLILARSGVYSFEEYLKELNKLLERHFSNEGRKHYSVGESSYDLWLDGYEKGIPGRKVSIYNEGALAALILDLTIRKKHNNQRSLDDVMRLMWTEHGSNMTGYSTKDYQNAAETIFEEPLDDYFNEILFGKNPFEERLIPLLKDFGIELNSVYPENSIEKDYGFKLNSDQVVIDIDVHSKAYQELTLRDKVLETSEAENGLQLKIERYDESLEVIITKSENPNFEIYQAQKNSAIKGQESAYLKAWLENCIQ